jgi:hypothetical protein
MKTSVEKLRTVLIAAGILFVAGLALIRQGKMISQFQHENRALQEEIRARDRAATSDKATSGAALEEELRRLRTGAQEVHKLRNEVSQLRALRRESETLREENLRLKSAPRASDLSGLQSAQQPEYFAKENWIFAGYATPDAALQSSQWAMREGDLKALQASMTPEAEIGKALGNEELAAKIEAEIRRKVRETPGYRILERKAISENEVVLRIHADGAGSSTGDQNILLKRLDGEWKVERSYRDAPVSPSQSP